ncbi:uncharacterized protein [Chelonus insularis]|nr:uncharacterized protein LOC118064923 [Chelonus insularis]XP_034940873.1 uncharacterized protein LOC118067949 isoform X1 [Chelonus insularis]
MSKYNKSCFIINNESIHIIENNNNVNHDDSLEESNLLLESTISGLNEVFISNLNSISNEKTISPIPKKKTAPTSNLPTSKIPIMPLSSTSSRNSQNEIKPILKCFRGRLILAEFNLKNTINRRLLTSVIIESELENSKKFKITAERFKKLTKDLVELFPDEEEDLYYTPWTKGTNGPIGARGLLYDKYINLRRTLFELEILTSDSNIDQHEISNTNDILPLSDSLLWLKNHIEPFSEVLLKWQESFKERLAYHTERIDMYFNTFNVLKTPSAYLLFESDFKQIHKEAVDKLILKWPSVAKKIINISKKRKDYQVSQYLKTNNILLANDSDLGNIEIIALELLPLLLGTINKKSKKSGKHWRPNITDIKQSFLFHAETIDELQPYIESKIRIYKQHKLTLQPFVVIIGLLDNIESSFVVINDQRYVLPTPLKAIDTCFKIIHALNATYSVECEHVWEFLEKYIYEVTKKTSSFTCVNRLISDLNRYKN